ncbi:MAG: glutamine-hydrolyzing GMP synthase [Clostridia bacterium]|nr:glutamine-hydrolyzing GMP synthase [Clostridia bacterium]
MSDLILVLDFGGQYKELIARSVREMNVLSLVKSAKTSLEEIKALNPKGIILTGGPNSVNDEKSLKCDAGLLELGYPVLGICYGMQAINHALGGSVERCQRSEYGQVEAQVDVNCPLFEGLDKTQKVLQSHTDQIAEIAKGFKVSATTQNCHCAGFYNQEKKIYGVQFHPETEHTQNGRAILENFVLKICGACPNYTIEDYIQNEIANIRKQVGNDKVLLALSGGVDSSVCAALLSKALPNQLVCVFVDHGFMRKNEADQVEAVFSKMDLQFVRVDAEQRFLTKLKGTTEPERKRKLIGEEFIRVFEEQSERFSDCKYLAQGTIYPDVIESGTGDSATIKSHHNVGGLPEDIRFVGLVEPLRGLFKDEVRAVGRILGLPNYLVNRQPFPGPGLAVRTMGELTKEKLDVLRDVDWIFREEIEKNKIDAQQYFAVLTSDRSVGVKGDERTYKHVVALRAINTTNFMTADFVRIPYDLLAHIAIRISNEVEGVSRVVYDISGKPPATIEWE